MVEMYRYRRPIESKFMTVVLPAGATSAYTRIVCTPADNCTTCSTVVYASHPPVYGTSHCPPGAAAARFVSTLLRTTDGWNFPPAPALASRNDRTYGAPAGTLIVYAVHSPARCHPR